MKKLLFALVCLILMALGSVFIWLQFPFIEDPDYLATHLARSRERARTLEKKASDPELNGFFQPDLRSYWDHSNLNSDHCPSDRIIIQWSQYPKAEHDKLWENQDQDYLAREQAFSPYLLGLRESLKKEVLTPQEPRDPPLESETLDTWSMKIATLASGVLTCTRSLLVRNRGSEASLNLELCWRLFHKLYLSGQAELGNTAAIHEAATRVLVSNFPPDSLPTESWLSLSITLHQSIVSPQEAHTVIEDQLLNTIATWRGSLKYYKGSRWERALEEREIRGATNDLISLLKAMDPNSLLTVPPHLNNRTYIRVLEPDYSIVKLHYDAAFLVRAEMAGLATCAGLFAYRAKHGKLPEFLEDLRTLGLEPVPSVPWEKMEYHPPHTLFVPVKFDTTLLDTEKLGWMKRTPNGIEFYLTPSP